MPLDEKPTYKHLLEKLVCTEPLDSCYKRTCPICTKNKLGVYNELHTVLVENDIEEISYKMWTTTDRCTIVEVLNERDDFVETLIEKVEKLILHDFISKKQSRYFADLKAQLKRGEFLAVEDFAENYAFIV